MASVVIVTEQCYMLAEAVNYIVINEDDDCDNRDTHRVPALHKKRKKRLSLTQQNAAIREYIQEQKPFVVVINFIPKGTPPQNSPHLQKHSNGDDTSTIHVKVLGLRRSLKIFKDIVQQLREQIPDEKFLDTLVDRFLASVEDEDHVIERTGIR